MSGAGTITLDAVTLGADATTVGGAIAFGGAVTGDKGSATAVGTGAGAGAVTFGTTLGLSAGSADDLTITAGTGVVTFTGAVAMDANDLIVASSQNSVITAGIGVDELVKRFEDEHDDYQAIMAKARENPSFNNSFAVIIIFITPVS